MFVDIYMCIGIKTFLVSSFYMLLLLLLLLLLSLMMIMMTPLSSSSLLLLNVFTVYSPSPSLSLILSLTHSLVV